MRSTIFAAAVAAAAVMPLAGHASHGISAAECAGVVAPGATAVCEANWVQAQPGFVSNLETHGNFHELLAMGSVTLEWIDAAGNNVMTSSCTLVGLALELPTANPDETEWVGPFEAQNATCTTAYADPAEFVEGTQTLRVTAAADSCGEATECRFHGHIEISDDSALF